MTVTPTPLERPPPPRPRAPERTAVRRIPAAPPRWLVAALIALGMALRLERYLDDWSLWLDEALLALNVVDRDATGLVSRTLDYRQAAPPGFLLLVEAAALAFGETEQALRFVPFLAALASVPLFAAVARRFVGPWPALLALALFALLEPLVARAAELKQYGLDAAAAIAALALLLWLADERATVRRGIAAGAAGLALLALSFPSALVLAAGAVVLAGSALRAGRRPALRATVAAALVWGGGGLAPGLVVLRITGELRDSVVAGLERASGVFYLPIPPDSAGELVHALASQGRSFVFASVGIQGALGFVFAAVAAVGLASLLRRDAVRALLLAGPIAAAVAASGLELYPFGGRFATFAVPLALLLAVEGVRGVVGLSQRAGPVVAALAGTALAAALLAWPAVKAVDGVRADGREEIEPLLATIQARWRAGDALYVDYFAQYPLAYYLECDGCGALRRQASPWAGLRRASGGAAQPAPALEARSPDHVVDRRWYDADASALAGFRGRERVWVLLTHIGHDAGRERAEAVTRLAESLGRQRLAARAPGAAAFLYDFTVP